MPVFNEIVIDTQHYGKVLASRHNALQFTDEVAAGAKAGHVAEPLDFNQWQNHIKDECSIYKSGTTINRDIQVYPSTAIAPRRKGLLSFL